MLERLLNRILQDHVVSVAELAGELDTSPEMIESMLAQLERLGYLEAVQGCDDGMCAGCSGPKVCRPTRLWAPGRRFKKMQAGDS